MQSFINFGTILDACRKGRPLIFAGMANVLLSFYKIHVFAFCMHCECQIPCRNPPKRGSNDEKIGARNELIFNIDF